MGVDVNEKAVMEMRNSGDVPGMASQGARAETAHVIDEVDDNNFNDLQGKPGGRGRGRRRHLRRNTP
jgi:hypothetical protein